MDQKCNSIWRLVWISIFNTRRLLLICLYFFPTFLFHSLACRLGFVIRLAFAISLPTKIKGMKCHSLVVVYCCQCHGPLRTPGVYWPLIVPLCCVFYLRDPTSDLHEITVHVIIIHVHYNNSELMLNCCCCFIEVCTHDPGNLNYHYQRLTTLHWLIFHTCERNSPTPGICLSASWLRHQQKWNVTVFVSTHIKKWSIIQYIMVRIQHGLLHAYINRVW